MVEVGRAIVNFGVYRPTELQRQCRKFSLYCQVEREDSNASKNTKRQRPSSFYGYAQGIYRGYVVWEKPLSFADELIYEWENPDVVLLTSLDCQTKTILDTIDNLAVALGLTPLGPYEGETVAIRMPLDRVIFKLFGKTTVWVRGVFAPAPEACSNPINWVEPEAPGINLENSRLAQEPPIIPINEDDPAGYDLGSPPYDGNTDGGETYNPNPPECEGCSITLTYARPGDPRFPGGPPSANPNQVINYAANLCPISLEIRPDDGQASYEKSGDFVVRDKNGNILNTYSSYTFNPFTAEIDNGFC